MCEDNKSLEYIQGKLDAQETITFLEHVINCNECLNDVKELSELKKVFQETMEPVPETTIVFHNTTIMEQIMKPTRRVFNTVKHALFTCAQIIENGGNNE